MTWDDLSAAKNSTAEFVICPVQWLRRSGTRYNTSCSPLHRAAAIYIHFNAVAVITRGVRNVWQEGVLFALGPAKKSVPYLPDRFIGRKMTITGGASVTP